MIHWLRLHKTFRLLQHFNRLQLQTFTLINQRTANTIKQTAHTRPCPVPLRDLQKARRRAMFEDIGTLHDRYQEFDIYPLLTLLASFARKS